MSKVLIKISILSLCFVVPFFVRAQVIITEIMYDLEGTDTGREWIEVRNTGNDQIDFETWKLFEANTNHKITALNSPIIPAGGYAIVADVPEKFKADNPNFQGLLFDSAFSLSNDGETLVLRDQVGSDRDSVSYMPSIGAQGNGMSLQRLGSSWISAHPTLGVETTATQSEQPVENTPADTSASNRDAEDTDSQSQAPITVRYSTHASQEVATISYSKPEFEISAGRPRIGFVGVPLAFEAKAKAIKNIPLGNTVNSYWTMGDGAQKSGQFISHAYQYPGDYIVVLNSDIGGANAVSRVSVKILEPKVSIQTAPDYVEIGNADDFELNVGTWIIGSGAEKFILPQDTLIAPHSSIKIPRALTKINAQADSMFVANPSGRILAHSIEGASVSFGTPAIGEQAVVLPQGMDAALVKERLMLALGGESIRSSAIIEENVKQSPTTTPVVIQMSEQIGSSTPVQAAAVVYTVPDGRAKGWLQKFIGIFGK